MIQGVYGSVVHPGDPKPFPFLLLVGLDIFYLGEMPFFDVAYERFAMKK